MLRLPDTEATRVRCGNGTRVLRRHSEPGRDGLVITGQAYGIPTVWAHRPECLGYWILVVREIGGTYGQIDESEVPARRARRRSTVGITCLDTAEAYGMGISEEALSRALGRPKKGTSSSRRSSASATRGMPNRRDSSRTRVLASIDKSLQRLRTDHVDIICTLARC